MWTGSYHVFFYLSKEINVCDFFLSFIWLIMMHTEFLILHNVDADLTLSSLFPLISLNIISICRKWLLALFPLHLVSSIAGDSRS